MVEEFSIVSGSQACLALMRAIEVRVCRQVNDYVGSLDETTREIGLTGLEDSIRLIISEEFERVKMHCKVSLRE